MREMAASTSPRLNPSGPATFRTVSTMGSPLPASDLAAALAVLFFEGAAAAGVGVGAAGAAAAAAAGFLRGRRFLAASPPTTFDPTGASSSSSINNTSKLQATTTAPRGDRGEAQRARRQPKLPMLSGV